MSDDATCTWGDGQARRGEVRKLLIFIAEGSALDAAVFGGALQAFCEMTPIPT